MAQLLFTVAAATSLIVACGRTPAARETTGTPAPAPSPGLKTPATFSGEIPCADCPGIRLTLTLRPDKLFILRRTYLERSGGPSVGIGLWWVSDDRRTLTLVGGRERLQRFAIRSADTLRMLDSEGREIESQPGYDIVRLSQVVPITEPADLRGMFVYMADAGTFTECTTGRRWPVDQAADNRALERGYLQARREPGQPVLVKLRGHLETRPNMEGTLQEMLVVDQYLASEAGGSCPAGGERSEGTPLEETYWKVMELRGRPVSVFDNQREAYLQFRSGDRVVGSGGCNQLGGSYTIAGDTLRLSNLASTMMACAQGMDQEQALLRALATVTRYAITRDTLRLFAGEELVTRLEAQYMK
jgi:copper homeostasis protein (lipoprotein)